MGRTMTGRPTALTPEVQEQAVQLARAGAKGAIIADVIGVHESTYRKWLQWGDDRWEPKPTDEQPLDRQPYREFREAIRKAQAQPVMLCEATWLKAVQDGDPKAAERWLRLHRPDLYREEINVNHGVDANAAKVVDALAAYKDVIDRVLPDEGDG